MWCENGSLMENKCFWRGVSGRVTGMLAVFYFPLGNSPNVPRRGPNVTRQPKMYTTPMGAFHVSRSIPMAFFGLNAFCTT